MFNLAYLSGRSHRPAAKHQAPLPPFDPDDSGGQVHTTPPPELVIPSGPDRMFLRADFNGVNLSESRWGTPPILVGANTTPVTMLMTPMLPMYPRKWQDACLTEHAERGYSHFVVAEDGWNFGANRFGFTPQSFVAWCQYVQSWGFYVVYWKHDAPVMDDPYLNAGLNARAIDWHIAGKEVESFVTPEQYAPILDAKIARIDGQIPLGTHHLSNWPSGFPSDTFFDGSSMSGFDHYNGKLHLMWQADQRDSAGAQGARMYYARQRVNVGGGEGGDGGLAPDSRVYAFEIMATAQLYGECSEEYGCLRSLELLYGTRTDPRIPAVNGYGNGCRKPDGSGL